MITDKIINDIIKSVLLPVKKRMRITLITHVTIIV